MTSQSLIGQKLGSFTVDSKIGSGAMGEVYRATHDKTGRTAAVKVIYGDPGKGNAAARFDREAQILEQFRHPNIVRLYARGRYQGTSYYAMEYVEGVNLDDVLAKRGYLPWREVVELGIQICEALHYAHEKKVVHRDLKPSNLMLTAQNQIKLTDFGIAKALESEALTATGRTLGTAAYMAPEQISATSPISHKTDLYALGCLFFQMLTGQPPFSGKSAVVLMNCHLNQPAPRTSSKNPDVPKELDLLVNRLMAKAVSDRPWDAEQVAVILRGLKEKADRGEPVKMVFDDARAAVAEEAITAALAAAPARGSSDGVPAATTGGTGRTRGTGGTTRTRTRAAAEAEAGGGLRGRLVTAGLVAALAAMIGFAAYMLWPHSEGYLLDQARDGIATKDRGIWRSRVLPVLDEIERRFPGSASRDEVAGMREQIQLAEAEMRLAALESKLPGVKPPKPGAEQEFLVVKARVEEAVKAGQHARAEALWRGYVATVDRRADPSERGWEALAQQQADEETRARALQLKTARSLLGDANVSERGGLRSQAVSVWTRLVQDYEAAAAFDDELAEVVRVAADKLAELEGEPAPGEGDRR